MAGTMCICAGLVGPKSENVDFSLVVQAFLKGQWSHEGSRESLQTSEPGHFLVEKAIKKEAKRGKVCL